MDILNPIRHGGRGVSNLAFLCICLLMMILEAEGGVHIRPMSRFGSSRVRPLENGEVLSNDDDRRRRGLKPITEADGALGIIGVMFSLLVMLSLPVIFRGRGGTTNRNSTKNVMDELMNKVSSTSFQEEHKGDLEKFEKMSHADIAGIFGFKTIEVYKFMKKELNNTTRRSTYGTTKNRATKNRRSTLKKKAATL